MDKKKQKYFIFSRNMDSMKYIEMHLTEVSNFVPKAYYHW